MEQGEHKVRIRIRSSQTPLESGTEENEMELFAFGKYYRKNDRHYLFYEELIEGTDRMTSNRVTIMPGRMELLRRGAVNTVMTFEPGRMVRENYHTPYGALSMGVDTQKLRIQEKEDGLEAEAEYLLEVNGEITSFNHLVLDVEF